MGNGVAMGSGSINPKNQKPKEKWDKLGSIEKVERLREALMGINYDYLQRNVKNIDKSVNKLLAHQHDKDGRMVVSFHNNSFDSGCMCDDCSESCDDSFDLQGGRNLKRLLE